MSFFTYRKIILSSLLLSAVLLSACSDAFRAEDPDETITVSGQVIDQANGQPVASALVEITSPEEFQQSTTTDSTGHYSFTLQSEESVTLTIEASKADFETTTQNLTATPGSDLTTVNLALADSSDGSDGDGTDEGKGAAGIFLETTPPQAINIAQTGEAVSTAFNFQVQDSAGNALNSANSVLVKFKLLSSPGGDEELIPKEVETNEQGQASTTLYSGNKAGEVKVQAIVESLDGITMKSTPISIAIHGGFPDLEHFSMSRSKKNIEGIKIDGNRSQISVILGDEFSNPVKPGTIVYFESNAGIVQGSARTDEDGQAIVDLISSNPRPDNGIATVTASTINKNDERIKKTVDVVFSSSEATIQANPTSFDLSPGESKKFNITVTDINGNPMAEGTQISVSGSEGLTLSGDTDITLGDHLSGGSGVTEFSFTAQDDKSSKSEQIELTITVTSPSGQQTVYNEIKGTRIIEGSEQVGAAAIVLTQEPEDFININETGDNVSAPLTFEVRDSLGRPLTAENAVEVEFDLVSSPGGGEDLVPSIATTDGSGQVTTTLFSGNRAGEVKVQATINRPEIGLSINSKPVLIAIHGGFPDEEHFSIAPDKSNFEAYNINNNRNTITVVLGDKFSNPVKPGTVVYFETTGGIIQGSAKTDEDGVAEVQLISGDPRPANGKIEVTASTVNESDIRIQKTIPLIMGTTGAIISSNKTTFDIPPNGGTSFEYEVTDLNGNPMPAGTQITIDAGEGIEVSGDANFTLGDYITTGPGKTEFKFSIRDTDDESNDPADLTILIKVTAPSGNSTIYSEISGTRRGIQ